MKYEAFLQERHFNLFPQLLDDDIPDHFDNWLGELDGEEYITYAELYGKQEYLKGREELLNEFSEILNKYNE